LRRLIEQIEPAAIVCMLQGEQAASAGMIAPEKPFEFFFPGEEGGVAVSGEIVPFDLLFSACKQTYRLIAQLLDQLKPAINMPAIALSPPPPVGDAQFILASNPKFANISEHLQRRGLPSTRWRQRMWRLHTAALRTIYQERGIAFVDPPLGSLDADGCLSRPFWADVFHANTAYGRLLLRQVESFVRAA
jgi:hypothetical protein